MLAKGGRFGEALSLAHVHFREADSVLRLAQTLQDMGQPDLAYELAHWGLSPQAESADDRSRRAPGRHALACWLREAAPGAGRPDLAIMAAQAAFEESLSREDYRLARDLCPAQAWQALQRVMLNLLMDAPYAYDRLDILLDEGRVEDAMALVDRDGDSFHSRRDPALMRLAMAASSRHPAWTIQLAWRMASPIIEEGRSRHYEIAVQWLDMAARAHAGAATTEEWRRGLDTLIQTHRRKRNLRALLEGLRARDYP
jgi:uncharacterized Zn finger protein